MKRDSKVKLIVWSGKLIPYVQTKNTSKMLDYISNVLDNNDDMNTYPFTQDRIQETIFSCLATGSIMLKTKSTCQ